MTDKGPYKFVNILLPPGEAHVFTEAEGAEEQFQAACKRIRTRAYARLFDNELDYIKACVKEFQELVRAGLATEEIMSEQELFKRHGIDPKKGKGK